MNSINIPILSFLRGGYIKIVESFVNTIYHYSKWKFFMDFASNGRRPRLIPIISIRWKFLNPVFRFVMKLRADRYCPSRASIVYMYSTRGVEGGTKARGRERRRQSNARYTHLP